MRNRGLIITLIVLISILIIILVAFLWLCLSGKFKMINWKGKKSNQVIFDTNYELSEVESLEILSTAGDIYLKESTDETIRVVAYGENEANLAVDFEKNQLKVDYTKYQQKKMFFGFHFSSNDIVVYLPKTYEKDIQIKANYGDIEVIDLEKATVDIEEDCGDVVLGKVKNAFVKNHYGDIKIAEIGNQVLVESDCGDVKIGSVKLAEDSKITNSFGDIKIGQTNEIYIEAKTDLGDVKVNKNERHAEITLKIENDCGDIKVEN